MWEKDVLPQECHFVLDLLVKIVSLAHAQEK